MPLELVSSNSVSRFRDRDIIMLGLIAGLVIALLMVTSQAAYMLGCIDTIRAAGRLAREPDKPE